MKLKNVRKRKNDLQHRKKLKTNCISLLILLTKTRNTTTRSFTGFAAGAASKEIKVGYEKSYKMEKRMINWV